MFNINIVANTAVQTAHTSVFVILKRPTTAFNNLKKIRNCKTAGVRGQMSSFTIS